MLVLSIVKIKINDRLTLLLLPFLCILLSAMITFSLHVYSPGLLHSAMQQLTSCGIFHSCIVECSIEKAASSFFLKSCNSSCCRKFYLVDFLILFITKFLPSLNPILENYVVLFNWLLNCDKLLLFFFVHKKQIVLFSLEIIYSKTQLLDCFGGTSILLLLV